MAAAILKGADLPAGVAEQYDLVIQEGLADRLARSVRATRAPLYQPLRRNMATPPTAARCLGGGSHA